MREGVWTRLCMCYHARAQQTFARSVDVSLFGIPRFLYVDGQRDVRGVFCAFYFYHIPQGPYVFVCIHRARSIKAISFYVFTQDFPWDPALLYISSIE